MEFATTPNDWLKQALLGDAYGITERPDWLVLRARLITARTARLAIASSAPAACQTMSGSFDPAFAQRIAGYDADFAATALPRVNPISLADGNRAGPIPGTVAGESAAGDRGRI